MLYMLKLGQVLMSRCMFGKQTVVSKCIVGNRQTGVSRCILSKQTAESGCMLGNIQTGVSRCMLRQTVKNICLPPLPPLLELRCSSSDVF